MVSILDTPVCSVFWWENVISAGKFSGRDSDCRCRRERGGYMAAMYKVTIKSDSCYINAFPTNIHESI